MTSRPAVTNDVYEWPEFEAFVKRLGRAIRLDRSLTIELVMDSEVLITQKYIAHDEGPASE